MRFYLLTGIPYVVALRPQVLAMMMVGGGNADKSSSTGRGSYFGVSPMSLCFFQNMQLRALRSYSDTPCLVRAAGGSGPDALLTAAQVAQVRAQAVAAALRKPKTAADQVGDPNHAAARFCLPP